MTDISLTAKKIQNARKAKGWSRRELAEKLNITIQTISKWERAISLPSTEMLVDLSEALDLPIHYILNKEPQQPSSIYAHESLPKLNHNMIVVHIGIGLLAIGNEETIDSILELRESVYTKTGVLLPRIRMEDVHYLSENQLVIKLLDRTVVNKTYSKIPDMIGYDICDLLNSEIQKILYEFVNRHMVKLLVEELRQEFEFSIEGVIPERFTLSRLKIILKMLVRRGKSICNLLKIIELIDEIIDEAASNEQIIEYIINEMPG